MALPAHHYQLAECRCRDLTGQADCHTVGEYYLTAWLHHPRLWSSQLLSAITYQNDLASMVVNAHRHELAV